MARKINEEQSLSISESFTATGTSKENYAEDGEFNVSITGTYVATVEFQRSFDQKATWETVESITGTGTPANDRFQRTGSSSVKNQLNKPLAYRFEVTAYTSGTVNVKATQ